MERTFSQTNDHASSDEESEFTREFHADRRPIVWNKVLQHPRVLLVAEAGAGKSHECEAQAKLLFARGEPAFFLRLELVAADGVRDLLRPKQLSRFKAWLASSSQVGYFFLDSIDELQLVYGSFKNALLRVAEDLDNALGRAVIVVTSRPVPIDRKAFSEILPVPLITAKAVVGDEFVQVAMRDSGAEQDDEPDVKIKEFSLLPLSNPQILELAREHQVEEPEKLLKEIEARNAHDFARWPQELIELCDDWRIHRAIRPHRQQIESHLCARLSARPDRREKADLSLAQARAGAQELALAVLLCRRFAIRHGDSADMADSGEEPIDPRILLRGWSVPQIAALLERPLFGDGGYGRVRFRHRSVLEYLAACQIDHQISTGTLSLAAAKRMLLGLTDTNEAVAKPSLRPLAAWLASLRRDFFEALLEVDPGVLLIHGDPESLEDLPCQKALRGFVLRHGKGQWRGVEVPSLQTSRLARKPLGATIVQLWAGGIENPEIRDLLLRIAASGAYKECADLAAAVAANRHVRRAERFEALVVLSKLGDVRLPKFVQLATSMAPGWALPLGRWVGSYLYPEHVSDGQLLTLLGKVKRDSPLDSDYSNTIATVVEHAELGVPRLQALLHGLTAMTQALVKADDDGDVTEPEGRLKTSLILRAVCVRLLDANVCSPEVLEAAVIAFRSASKPYHEKGRNVGLAQRLNALGPEQRRLIFSLDYLWVIGRFPTVSRPDVWLGRLMHDAPISYSLQQDQQWVLAALGDKKEDVEFRAMLLRLAVYLAPMKDGKLSGVSALKRRVADSPVLVEQLKAARAACEPSPDVLRAQARHKAETEKHRRKAAKQREVWRGIWKSLAKKPAQALSSKRRATTIWNISIAMRLRRKSQGETRWSRAFLERNFGAAVTDQVREALMAEWRTMHPTLRKEREAGDKDSHLVVWTNGLMGLYAEAEDAAWATGLTADEAEQATRYAMLESNSLPNWLVALAVPHPMVVGRILGEEIEDELLGPSTQPNWYSMNLQKLRHGPREISSLVEARLIAWMRTVAKLTRRAHNPALQIKLEQVASVLLTHESPASRNALAKIGVRELDRGIKGAYRNFWVGVLCRADPLAGLDRLLQVLGSLPIEKDGDAVALIGYLFGERHALGKKNWREELPPASLAVLVRAVQWHVRPEHDLVHIGAYSPRARDDSEDARRYTFNELMARQGAGAAEAKLSLTTDANYAHLSDHIRELTRERLAAEVDASVFDVQEVTRLLHGFELPPKTGSDMAHLLVDRLDDLDELMLRDTSPRAAWAMVEDENALRPAIAREFEVNRQNAYTVDQEAVTADGKETDIRLRSTSGHQATIELKVGEKSRSAAALRNTIQEQLVRKYMAHKDARTGCLLVTVKDPKRRWQHPDTGAKIDLVGLQQLLNEAAQVAQLQLGGDARVLARVLDLRPRLPTEATASKGKAA
ncbi:MAG: ATP-binding protein [Roseateles sp.]|nr:MAG: ATP-binding protein [Roseateles sp.]